MNFRVFGSLLFFLGLSIICLSGFLVLRDLPESMNATEFQQQYDEWYNDARLKRLINSLAFIAPWPHPNNFEEYAKIQSDLRMEAIGCFYNKLGTYGSFVMGFRTCPVMGFSVVITYSGLSLTLLGLIIFLSARRSPRIGNDSKSAL